MQINDDDPNASLTRKRVQTVKNCCISSGLLDKRFATVYICLWDGILENCLITYDILGNFMCTMGNPTLHCW